MRAELVATIREAVQVSPPYVKKMLALQQGTVRKILVEDLNSRILGKPESETVNLQPDLAAWGMSQRPGTCNVDEPHAQRELRKRW